MNARDHGFEKEEAVVLQLYQGNRGPVKILATAILLFRLLHARAGVMNEILRLQCQLPDGKSPSEESQQHSQAVIATVVAMCRIPSNVNLGDMINRIKINGFSIADGESIALGIGIYSLPSFMNHSCQPNTIQTFLHGHNHQPPTLFLTAYTDITPGQEIMISYLDNSAPRHIRRARLLEDYFFLCDCSACGDNERESRILGARCSYCHNSTKPLRIVDSLAPSPWSLQCSACLAEGFEKTLDIFHSFASSTGTDVNLSILKERFEEMRRLCFPTSWYMEESGERLVHAVLDKLGQSQTIDEQQNYAIQALEVLNLLLDDTATGHETQKWSSTSLAFRRAIRWFQSAKLRLFLYPDPTTAIQLLDKAHTLLSVFYPGNHELMSDLKSTMQSARR
jgi:SET domain